MNTKEQLVEEARRLGAKDIETAIRIHWLEISKEARERRNYLMKSSVLEVKKENLLKV